MQKITLQPDKEDIKTVELEPGQSLRIKLIGEEETKHEVILEPEAIKAIWNWIGENYLEYKLNGLASAVCFFSNNAMCEDIEDQPSHFDNIQAIAHIHQDLIKFFR